MGRASTSLAVSDALIRAAITRETIGLKLSPQTAAEASAGATPINYAKFPSPIRDASRYVSDNTGATDVESEMQAFLDISNGEVIIPPGTYLLSQLAINDKAGFRLYGKGATIRLKNVANTTEGLRIEGTCSDIEIDGLAFQGDDRADGTFPQIGVHFRPLAANILNQLRLLNIRGNNLTQGIALLAETAGTLNDVFIGYCRMVDMAGEAGGSGYGYHVNFGNTLGLARIIGNYAEKCHRHSYYISRPRKGTIVSLNEAYLHRDGNSDADKAAFVINRGTALSFTSNICRESVDTAFRVDTDDTATLDDVEEILVGMNQSIHNKAVDFHIGGGAPATSSRLRNLVMSQNIVRRLDASNTQACVEIRQGLSVSLEGNQYYLPTNFPALYSVIHILGAGESSGTAKFSDDLNIGNEKFHGGGINFRPIRIDNAAAGSSIHMTFDSNKYIQIPFSIVNSIYQWTASGSGTSEYYLELSGGGDPSVGSLADVIEDGSVMTEATVGSLSAGEWDFGDNDALGFNTIYVRLADGADPDTKDDGFIKFRTAVQEFHIPQGTMTNPNIRVMGQRHRGLDTSKLLAASNSAGTATILSGNTSITVTHGLGITPVNHQLTATMLESPSNDPGNIWIDTIGATQFKINCRSDPGASNLNFAWRYHPIE